MLARLDLISPCMSLYPSFLALNSIKCRNFLLFWCECKLCGHFCLLVVNKMSAVHEGHEGNLRHSIVTYYSKTNPYNGGRKDYIRSKKRKHPMIHDPGSRYKQGSTLGSAALFSRININ